LSKKYGPVHLSIIQTLKVTSQLEHVASVLQLQKSPTNRSLFSFMKSEQPDLSSFQLCLTVHLNNKSKYYFAYTLHNIRSSNLILIKIQPDATICRYLFTAKSLYMFRVSQHPSSGVLKTVTAASGTGHTVKYRD